MERMHADASVFVIFGGTGDLAQRKLLPALCRMAAARRLDPQTQVVGVARSEHTDESYRELVRGSLLAAGLSNEAADGLCARVHFQSIQGGGAEAFESLAARIEALRCEGNLPPNRVLYLSIPPGSFPDTVHGLARAGLNDGDGFTRLVLEKPFGRDLQSARELNHIVHEHFREDQIYRIDHYLGKDTVQNLLVFRFANALFESAWNRERVQAVQISVAESGGVGTRAGYYDDSGATRDMLQNHLTQLLTLVGMEVPSAYEDDAIRYEKIKLLRSIAPIAPQDAVRGQYTAGVVDGKEVPGYLDAGGVRQGSQTDTFVAVRIFVDNWRWQGVPFYLRTGKCLPRTATQIAVQFRQAPINLFESMGGSLASADLLIITLQPDEGFSLHCDVKTPGSPVRLRRIPLTFKYKELFPQMPEAYETLLADVLTGDQTLFVHAAEVEEAWRAYAPLIDDPLPVCPYAAGTWGPPEAERLAIAEDEIWQVR